MFSKKTDEQLLVEQAVEKAMKHADLDNWTAFAKETKLKKAQLNKIRSFITVKDSSAKPVFGETDTDLRDTENIPFSYEGGIEGFIQNEVIPFAPDAYIDEKKTQIGYEISFTKYFYKPNKMRSIENITADLERLENEADGMLKDILGGVHA